MIDVTLNGKRYSMTETDVERVADEAPDSPRRYAVEIKQKSYPIKQAASTGLGVPPVAFTSQQAYQWLSRLGFDVIDLKG